ncbi:hypothetical protein Tco_0507634 [Tanacetum coccineum]
MLVENRYPLTKEVLSQMLDLKLETEEESTMALELIKFVKQQLEEFEDSNDDDLVTSDHEEAERQLHIQLQLLEVATSVLTLHEISTLTKKFDLTTVVVFCQGWNHNSHISENASNAGVDSLGFNPNLACP